MLPDKQLAVIRKTCGGPKFTESPFGEDPRCMSIAGVWRNYRDICDHGYGGNWRRKAGFPFSFLLRCVLTMRRKNIGRRGMSQEKKSFLFYVFSGRIQSSRYVKGV